MAQVDGDSLGQVFSLYDDLPFPSRVSGVAYEEKTKSDLKGLIIKSICLTHRSAN